MKNVNLNQDRIVEKIINSNEFTESSVENAIKTLSWHASLKIVDSENDAEVTFKEWFADSDFGAEKYMNHFGGVHSNCIETFTLNVTDPTDDYTHQFKVSIYEYYVDSGSVDYIYRVSASKL